MGLCQGMPQKIPVVEKDFIFSAIAEELGGIFAVLRDLDLSGLLFAVYVDRHPHAGGVFTN